jgi:hypothetical protein
MKTGSFLLDVVITIVVTFVVAAVVTFLYSLVVHGTGATDWATAIRLAIIIGIAVPLTRIRPGQKTG